MSFSIIFQLPSNLHKQSFPSRENVANGLNLSQLGLNVNNLKVNPSTLHRKAKSNVNLNTMEISDNSNGFQPSKPVINHGKPNLAPKPPVLNGKNLLYNEHLFILHISY